MFTSHNTLLVKPLNICFKDLFTYPQNSLCIGVYKDDIFATFLKSVHKGCFLKNLFTIYTQMSNKCNYNVNKLDTYTIYNLSTYAQSLLILLKIYIKRKY